jgi:acyl-CoA synthetase (AMP-forming)/AMP-acid ligase II
MLWRGGDDAPALLQAGEVLCHGALRSAVAALGGRLLGRGWERGERVGLFAENAPFFVTGYLAILRTGLVAVPFQTDVSEDAFRRIVASTRMRCILVSKRHLPRVGPWAEALGVEVLGEPEAAGPGPDPAARFPELDPARDLAAILYTSGSTGEPKGVMVTHRNILVNTSDIVSYMDLGAEDRAMLVLPLYYCFGLSLLHTHLAVGGSLVLSRSFMFPEKVLDEMAETGCTGLAGVPSTFQILLRKTRFASRSFPRLRWLQQAGGKLPNPFLRELRAAFPGVRLHVMYGQTEATARLSQLPPELLDAKLGSIGRGLPSTRLDVLRPDGRPVTPGSEEVGEIVASGENVTAGYWDDPEETARYFRDGRLFTGDLARVDADGFIYVVERSRDFIKSMGNRVSPKEVEDVVAELPEVVEVAVLGLPHEVWGEAIHCVVATARPGQLAAETLRNHCLKRLPNFKVPVSFRFVPGLPKTTAGKVDKARLRAEAPEGSP